jgi:hypothetical protein
MEAKSEQNTDGQIDRPKGTQKLPKELINY